MNILIINGPNLNLLGKREPEIYGSATYEDLVQYIDRLSREWGFTYKIVQTNHEGTIIDFLHEAIDHYQGIVINPGAYTHYSFAIHDAIKAIQIPTVEVHLSDITKRESFRAVSVIAPACVTQFYGEHFKSYYRAIKYLLEVTNV